MYKIGNLLNNDNVVELEKMGEMRVLEYKNDLSTNAFSAEKAYFANKMNIRKRQLLIKLNDSEYILSAGAMQWTLGNVEMTSDVKGVGDFFGKAIKGAVTKESAVKPRYKGKGLLMLEPTYRHILFENVADWDGGIVLDDGLFLACESSVQQKVVARSNISSALFGGEGLFNLMLAGNGIAALESYVPRSELVEINLENDVLKVDGNFAIAWSGSLEFTVEKSSKTLIGSGLSGEGLVNVYRGTGKVLLAPVNDQAMVERKVSAPPDNGTQAAKRGAGGVLNILSNLS